MYLHTSSSSYLCLSGFLQNICVSLIALSGVVSVYNSCTTTYSVISLRYPINKQRLYMPSLVKVHSMLGYNVSVYNHTSHITYNNILFFAGTL